MAGLDLVLDIIIDILHIVSIVILLWGVAVSVKDFIKAHIRARSERANLRELTATKNTLGGYVLYSLEVLIAADIIGTIQSPALEEILLLAAIVAIRTVISYFLNKEIRESGGPEEAERTTLDKPE